MTVIGSHLASPEIHSGAKKPPDRSGGLPFTRGKK
jgi:hypothetical protein